MAKGKTTAFFCQNCGYESAKWMGQCPACKEWNTFVEEPVVKTAGTKTSAAAGSTRRMQLQEPSRLAGIKPQENLRISTGMEELDRVLGGGIVTGSLVLVGGDPGIGKSTLLLQVCKTLANCAVIGGLSAVHQFCKIGRNAMIGGMARVTQDVPPFMICAGDPAFVSGLNSVGLSRAGMPVEERSELKKAFRILYRSGLPLQEAISTMEQELTSSEPMEHLMRFLRNVERGIIRTRRG